MYPLDFDKHEEGYVPLNCVYVCMHACVHTCIYPGLI